MTCCRWMIAGRPFLESRTTRLRVVEAVIPATLTPFAGSRRFTLGEAQQYQRILNQGVRLAFGLNMTIMGEHHYTDSAIQEYTKTTPKSILRFCQPPSA